ncbi:hypothetical protein R1flu_005842 [Riccia fluitans]|uniref:Uncharacterized protein n=1 Tax=Riccia fluitans TaxID=41844 RepID=A0ABD1YUJ6_9MARC
MEKMTLFHFALPALEEISNIRMNNLLAGFDPRGGAFIKIQRIEAWVPLSKHLILPSISQWMQKLLVALGCSEAPSSSDTYFCTIQSLAKIQAKVCCQVIDSRQKRSFGWTIAYSDGVESGKLETAEFNHKLQDHGTSCSWAPVVMTFATHGKNCRQRGPISEGYKESSAVSSRIRQGRCTLE